MKPPKGWQEKQWYPEDRPSVDLTSRLQSIEDQKYPKLQAWQTGAKKMLWTTGKWILGVGTLTAIGTALYLYFGVSWHTRLFSHWLLRQGDIQEVPITLHQELDQLCRAADATGQVNGYEGSTEIAYGLGHFQCLASEDGYFWTIRDTYGFDDSTEALAGTQLAEFLINLVGSDYTYEIEARIPRTIITPEIFLQ
jgi:hypothetical protein